MSASTNASRSRQHRVGPPRLRAGLVGAVALAVAFVGTTAGASTVRSPAAAPGPRALYPVGIPDAQEPSGEAPPAASALAGYTRAYVTDFTGAALPTGWGKFAGPPQGNSDAYWGLGHVIVGGGMVRLLTYKHGKRWVSGGMCFCRNAYAYAAFFIRSRVTGPGPDEDELLWPKAHVWPPEVDFNETAFATDSTSWTVHYGTSTAFVQGTHAFDLTKWHTWGVIWTPTSLLFTVDGVVWGKVTNQAEVPHRAMTLDIDQEARCNGTKWAACPTGEVALQIDWVSVFTHP